MDEDKMKVKSIKGKILNGWERAEASSGISYYLNHATETTHWDHPEMMPILEKLESFNDIKYVAYRTASKLRMLQKELELSMLRLGKIHGIFEDHGLKGSPNTTILRSCQLESFLYDLCFSLQKESSDRIDPAVQAELLVNLLLNIYNLKRTEGVALGSVKVGICVLCAGRLQDKHKYFFQQFQENGYLSRRNLFFLLQNLAKITEFLGENLSFGSQLVPAAVESCFQKGFGNQGVPEEAFVDWMFQEPQTLVWMSTLYRMTAAETVEHEAKCSVCKMCPIVGLRYRCLQCLGYDLCQRCFFHGQASKGHKLKHSMQEYCQPTSSWEETKSLLKTLGNKIYKWQAHHTKHSYLPIDSAPCPSDERVNDKDVDEDLSQELAAGGAKVSKMLQTEDAEKTLTPLRQPPGRRGLLDPEHQRELESIIVRLEDENRQLSQEIERLHIASENCSSEGSRSSQGSCDNQNQKSLLLARQEVLEDHNHQLELQVQRLKELLKRNYVTPKKTKDLPRTDQASNNGIYLLQSNKGGEMAAGGEDKQGLPRKQGQLRFLESTPAAGQAHTQPTYFNSFMQLQSELDALENLSKGLSIKTLSEHGHAKHGEKWHTMSTPVSSHQTATTNRPLFPDDKAVSIQGEGTEQSIGEVSVESKSSVACTSLSHFVLPKGDRFNVLTQVDAELQAIIDQLEKLLPHNLSEVSNISADEKERALRAAQNVEEAIGHIISSHRP
ncbi:dystrophin-like isoform X1 [Limulus polyphemus]|uniref:Dystrophin-like isoform X1 n=1 Tax=Limulus polyphemus TaxID=6850 RepID=A0ABM1SDB0_LIMPO|nr:dystrophin-like isoform X1 [Limulus polyphemus]